MKKIEINIEADCEQLLNFIYHKYTKAQRIEDVALIKDAFIDRDYARKYCELYNELT